MSVPFNGPVKPKAVQAQNESPNYGNFAPPQRSNAEEEKRKREDALLKKYGNSGEKTLDERIAERQKLTTDENRLTNAIKHVLIGLACFAAAIVTYFVLSALQNGGVAPRIVWPFVWLQGQYWVPILLAIPGCYNLFLAYWFMKRPSNVSTS